MREFEYSSMLSIPYVGQDTLIRFAHPTLHSRPSRPRLQSLSLRIFLATTISVVAALVSLSICRALRSRDQGPGVARRRLAEGGEGMDEDEVSIVEGCLELEEEMGFLRERAVSISEGDSSSRVAQLVSMLSAAAKESVMQGGLGADLQVHEQNLEGQSSFESRGGRQASVPAPSLPASVGRRESSDVIPALDPDSWMDGIPSISLEPEEQESDMLVGDTRDPPNTEQASASHASNSELPMGLKDIVRSADIRQHPYVHLPVLEEDVIPRDVHVIMPFGDERQTRVGRPYTRLLTLRALFAKKTLNQKNADLLVHTLKELVSSYLLRKKTRRKREIPVMAVEELGIHLIVFDYVVSAIQLLGEHMQAHLWWDKFTASLDINFPLPAPGSRGKELTHFHIDLARRLRAAINIYKRGVRPPLLEVIALKTLLFCSPLGRHRLKRPKWDPWRKDGGCS
ncbi:hypothetical protein, conserved [Eimeria praecox]|uniref:Uncharacterized protein n=1 Tax=Eimeria praecox TaxID=51316 RepID=U6H613_9EIME|nr:hypothetical protein, conserved [Eimeria praecox]